MRNWNVMRLAPCLAVALATVVGGGALFVAPAGARLVAPAGARLVAPAAAATPLVAEAAAATTAPAAPTIPTTVPLPTQSTSLTPVTAPATTAPPINDAKATRLVNRVVAALVGLGVLIALLTFWYWRSTKPVPPSLEGVELMSTRKWLRGKPDKRARLLGEYHAKRGPVPEESIARLGAATVRVGAAVAAPAPAPAMAAAPARSAAPEAADLRDLTDEPSVVMVGEDDESRPPSEPSGPPTPPPRPGVNGDVDSVFTVVARRPRTDGDTGAEPETS